MLIAFTWKAGFGLGCLGMDFFYCTLYCRFLLLEGNAANLSKYWQAIRISSFLLSIAASSMTFLELSNSCTC